MTNVYRVLPMCLVLIGFGLADDAAAALLTVTSLADDGSPGTLRSKIAAAAAGDTIDFSVTGTMTKGQAFSQSLFLPFLPHLDSSSP